MCYSDSICVDIKLNKRTMQEQWSLACEILEVASRCGLIHGMEWNGTESRTKTRNRTVKLYSTSESQKLLPISLFRGSITCKIIILV